MSEPEVVMRDLMSTLGWSEDRTLGFVQQAMRADGGHPVADAVATHLHDEFVDTTWSACPIHPSHPLDVTGSDDYETWRCPADDRVIARVGELGATGAQPSGG